MPQAEDILAFIEKVESPNVSIDQPKCLKVRNRNASCSRCMDACPAKCIYSSNNKLFVDGAACLGCLTCTSVCPTAAISPKRTSDTATFAAAASVLTYTPGQVTFACEEVTNAARDLIDTRTVVGLKCVSSVDVSLLVYLAAQNVPTITLVCGNCEACTLASCRGVAERMVSTANLLLETWNSEARVKITAKMPAACRKTEDLGYDQKRRHFFSDMRGEAKKVTADAANVAMDKAFGKAQESIIDKIKVSGNGTLPLIPNPRRKRLLAALDSLGAPRDEMIETDLWGQAIIDLDKCKACRICATFCPSGALFKFHTKSGKIGVKQMVRDCVNCHCCEDVCLHGALTLCPEVFAVDIAEGAVERYEMAEPKSESKFTFNM